MSKYKKGDAVLVLSGKDKGKSGTIEKVFPKQKKILVDKINVAKKHVKPSKEAEGGIKEISVPFDWSKARVVDAFSKKKVTPAKKLASKKPKISKTDKK